jgi:hypothetical protein
MALVNNLTLGAFSRERKRTVDITPGYSTLNATSTFLEAVPDPVSS